MQKIIISATSYLNTIPFVYGINKSGLLRDYELLLNVPSACAHNLIYDKADVGLIPVGSIKRLNEKYIMLPDYCLGANGKVKTVVLLSKKPLEKIKEIFLDFESATSVRLIRILARHYWKKNYSWNDIKPEDDYQSFDSLVAIGDKTFSLRQKYEYVYDLAEEWFKFTGLPFVFASWFANKNISSQWLENFKNALKYGVDNRLKAVKEFKQNKGININLEEYVEKYMNYDFDDLKHQALKMFLSLDKT